MKVNTKAVRREQQKQAHRANKQQLLRSVLLVDLDGPTPRERTQTPFTGSLRPAATREHWKGAERARVRNHLHTVRRLGTSPDNDPAPMNPIGKVPFIAIG